jgi:transglutaminase-like putative cysteine protease
MMGPMRSRRFWFTYAVEVPASKAPIDLWVPSARSDAFQTIEAVEVTAPVEHSIADEPAHGNTMVHVRLPASESPSTVELRLAVERRERRSPEATELPDPPAADFAPFTRELAPNAHVPIDGRFAVIARGIAPPELSPLRRARAIWDHLLETLEYDARGCTPERAGELGNLHLACDLRRGTCTEFHGLFVSYARAARVPARFAFGFNVPDRDEGTIAGYHCWAEIHLPGVGWFPIDVSEAAKRTAPAERSYYFGNLDPNRVQLTSGRDVMLVPLQQSGPVDKLIFPHAESGVGIASVRPSFRFRAIQSHLER